MIDEPLARLVALSRAESGTAEDRAAEVLRRAISRGILAPGERLPQEALARLLAVSRMPIRAALRQLEAEGLVELHPHRGASVRALASNELADLYEMRILVETFALRRTVRTIDDDQIEHLARLVSALDASTDHEALLRARHDFSRELYSIGNSARVVSTIMQFQAEVSRYTRDLDDPRSTTHAELLERIRLRDPELAAAWLESHLRHVARARTQQIAEQSGAPGG